ncbi:MAG: hypothetical protein AMJ67_12860 [Betaproteobacteria bacterium SG8_41]|nr:MAG: hypothetical protein AMJ67_12860 [Betaproteobacteria bacterium SG8_41]
MRRSEVLMTLGNPDRRIKGDTFFGYFWTETTAVVAVPYVPDRDIVRPHILMIEFDLDGKVKRMQELTHERVGLLNREVEKWIEGSERSQNDPS